MRFATSDRVITEDVAVTDHDGIRKVLHKILDLQLDKYIGAIARDLRDNTRIATVDVRTFEQTLHNEHGIILDPKSSKSMIVEPPKRGRLIQ